MQKCEIFPIKTFHNNINIPLKCILSHSQDVLPTS